MSVLNRFFSKKGMDLTDDWHTVNMPYFENAYSTQASVERCAIRYNPSLKIGVFRFNLILDKAAMPSGFNIVKISYLPTEITNLGLSLRYGHLFCAPGQASSHNLLVELNNDSGLTLYNLSGSPTVTSDFYRAEVPLVFQ